MSNRIFKTGLATAAALAALVTAAPMAAQAQANGVTNCDAPGGRQRAGALIGAVVGGAASASSNTVFVDSSAGIADGARTGLANVVTGVLFLAAMFFTPLYEIVPIEAAAPVLVVVGALMMMQVRQIEWSEFTIALPAFLTIVTMPLTYSIANGIGVGFISFTLMSLFAGKAKDIHWIMWLISALFVVYFAQGPIMAALS